MLNFALVLVFSHLLGDFSLQNRYMSEQKCKGWLNFYMFAHCTLYLVPFYFLLHLPMIWLGFLFITHLLIDAKLGCYSNTCDVFKGDCKKFPPAKVLLIDQLLHILMLLIVWGVR